MTNKPMNIGQNSIMDNFVKTDDILKDMRGIIETSQKGSQKNCPQSMKKGLRKQIFIAFIHFTRTFLRFSTHRVENLCHCYLGRITVSFCR